MGDDVVGDELYTYDDVHARGLGGLLDHLRNGGTEDNPPLFYVFAWLSAKLGDDTVWIRLPSLVAGTAAVPAVYLLGSRTLGRAAGLVAAAIVALSPFAVFYATEARAYALLVLLVALSTLLLLEALETGRRAWWAAYAVAACAVLYTHYTGALAVAAQTIWALWLYRDRWREIVAATAVAVIGYLPWIPTELGRPALIALAPVGPFTAGSARGSVLHFVPGHPFRDVATVPGTWVVVALAVLLAAALIALLAGRERRPTPGLALLLLLVAVPAAGLAAYSALRTNIFLSRNLACALPAVAVLIGGTLTSLGGRRGAAAGALAVALVGVGTVRTMGEEVRGSSGPEVGRYVEANVTPDDSIASISFLDSGGPVARGASIYFERSRENFYPTGPDQDQAWRRAATRGGRVFLIFQGSVFGHPRRAGPGECFRRQASRDFAETTVSVYALSERDWACAVEALFPGGIGYEGFSVAEQGEDTAWRWSTRPRATISVASASDEARAMTVSGRLGTGQEHAHDATLRIDDGPPERIRATPEGEPFTRRVVVPARGAVRMELSTTTDSVSPPGDPRTLYLRVYDLEARPAGGT